jgi:hypothetical protein
MPRWGPFALSNAFLIKIVPTSVEANPPPIADSSLDGSERYEHGIRKIASGEIKPDLICNRRAKHGFGKNCRFTKAFEIAASRKLNAFASGSVGGHDKKIDDQPLPSFADRNGYLAFLVLGIRANPRRSESRTHEGSYHIRKLEYAVLHVARRQNQQRRCKLPGANARSVSISEPDGPGRRGSLCLPASLARAASLGASTPLKRA